MVECPFKEEYGWVMLTKCLFKEEYDQTMLIRFLLKEQALGTLPLQIDTNIHNVSTVYGLCKAK